LINASFYDYIVLGSGVAGLRAAIELSRQGKVAIITKSSLGESNTEYAQGGVAVALSDDDDIYLHYEDTIRAGDGLCDKDAVMTLVEEGPKYIKELIKMGAKFDMHGDHLSFTREAAHSVNRIIHASGDATGHEIVRALKDYVNNIDKIDKIENYFVVDLIKCDNKVCGIITLDENDNSFHYFYSKAVIVATGGAGRIFERTTNPEVATGDGMAIAFRASATLKDMEFFQFHPTGLHVENAPAFLLSESMRGEGAVLKNIHYERFCHNYHEMGELAPRDVVSRAIFFEMQKTDSKYVFMDLTHLDSVYVKNRFPKIYSTCLKYGIDITKDLIPVSPAAHYYMGGIETDVWGRTNIYGLYACGETACTGVHGANRLASNSLLEGVVFGARAAKAAIIDTKYDEPSKPAVSIKPSMDNKLNYALLKTELQNIMWENVSVVRNERSLSFALEFIDNYLPKFYEKMPYDRDSGELKNMFIVSKLMTEAAIARKGSRGGHFRDDYPEKMNDTRHIVFENAQFSPTIR
jgi:L-aspartate oxidase